MSDSVSQKVARFEKALQLFLDRVRADPNLLAAALVGSLTEETVWRRSKLPHGTSFAREAGTGEKGKKAAVNAAAHQPVGTTDWFPAPQLEAARFTFW